MTHERDLTPESFNRLLGWLSPDLEEAGRKYEEIRGRLIKIFTCRGSTSPEEMADETMTRVARRVVEIADDYRGDQALYFYGVARRVYLESVRKRWVAVPYDSREVIVRDARRDEKEEAERGYACLEQCMEKLVPRQRELILEYYQEEKRAKIEHRRELADNLGIALNALRIQVHRIRMVLQTCVADCLKLVAAAG